MKIQCRQSAFSLLEVLVAMTILALGILAMCGLQSASLRSNQRAYFRTQATIYSIDMIERMQANLQAVDNGNYHHADNAMSPGCSNASSGGCSSTSMARNDLGEWQAAVEAGLPQGAAVVCLDSSPADGSVALPSCDGRGALYAIKIYWDENRDGRAEQNFITTFHP